MKENKENQYDEKKWTRSHRSLQIKSRPLWPAFFVRWGNLEVVLRF